LTLAFSYRACKELAFRGDATEQNGVTFAKVVQISVENCHGPEQAFDGQVVMQRTDASTVVVLNPLLPAL
jgi:hypothetical protein